MKHLKDTKVYCVMRNTRGHKYVLEIYKRGGCYMENTMKMYVTVDEIDINGLSRIDLSGLFLL